MVAQESFPSARVKCLHVCSDCTCNNFRHVHCVASFLFSASHEASVTWESVLRNGRPTHIKLSGSVTSYNFSSGVPNLKSVLLEVLFI